MDINDINRLFGWQSAPLGSSNVGPYGAYGLSITGDQAEPFADNLNQWIPVSGSSGGYLLRPNVASHGDLSINELMDAMVNPKAYPQAVKSYDMQYTPNFSGTSEAVRQANAASSRDDAMLHALGAGVVGAGLMGWYPTTAAGGVTAAPATGAVAPATAGVSEIFPVMSSGMPTLLETYGPAAAALGGGAAAIGTAGGAGAGAAGGAGLFGTLGTAASGALNSIGGKGLGALAGGLLAGSSLGNAKQAGTTTVTNVPWEPMQPYLMGLASDAQSLYHANRGTPAALGDIADRATQNAMGYQGLSGMGQDMAYQAGAGMFDPMLYQVGDINARQGFSQMGELDPSGAYARMLSGQVNPYVDQMAKSIADQTNQNLALNVLPSIRAGAQSAGQYGGTRQGVAEGVAAGLSNQGITNALAGLYGNAWGTAQGQMAHAADSLGQMGYGQQQANASLGMNRNTQNMQAAQQALQARQTGMGLGTSSFGLGMGALTDAYNMQSNLHQYPWQSMRNYQGVIQPLGGMGSSQSSPYYTNPASNIFGGMLSGAQLFGGK